jgi:hypothetical protein
MLSYCPNCPEPTLMEPDGDAVACPVCLLVDATAIRRPLLVLAGSSGAGKTTLFPLLVERLNGACLVFDVDWLIDPLKRSPDDWNSDEYWTAFRDTWLHIAHAVARNGLPTLLLAPFIPETLDVLPGRSWITEIHYAVLDCNDEIRRTRLASRPPWRAGDVEAQVQFGTWLRTNLSPVFDTTAADPASTAADVAAWVAPHVQPPASD